MRNMRSMRILRTIMRKNCARFKRDVMRIKMMKIGKTMRIRMMKMLRSSKRKSFKSRRKSRSMYIRLKISQFWKNCKMLK